MKQNITLTVDKPLLKGVRSGSSIGAILAEELTRIAGREDGYRQAK